MSCESLLARKRIEYEDDGKDPAVKALGAKGGTARAKKLTPEQRSEIARKAAQKRWKSSQKSLDHVTFLIHVRDLKKLREAK